MTRQELDKRLAECDRKMSEMESLIQEKIDIEMKSKYPDRMKVLRLKEQISNVRNRSIHQIDNIKKEYALQGSPADIGDVIEAEISVKKKGSKVREIIRYMRVERIEVAAYEEPQLTYYGTYLKQNGDPMMRQIFAPIHQADITRVIKLRQPN